MRPPCCAFRVHVGSARCLSSARALKRAQPVLPRGRVLIHDDLSVTQAQLLETTLEAHIPTPQGPEHRIVPESVQCGDRVPTGSHLVFFRHAVPESGLSADGYDSLQAPFFRDRELSGFGRELSEDDKTRLGMLPANSRSKNTELLRRWVSGTLEFNHAAPLVLGHAAFCEENVRSVENATRANSTITKIRVTIDREIRQAAAQSRAETAACEPWSVRESRTLLYHSPPPKPRRVPSTAETVSEPGADFIEFPDKETRITDALLFRYSALSFNAHRIHFDPVFAQHEGLTAPIAQGPLLTTLVLRWTERAMPGWRVLRMDYTIDGVVPAGSTVRFVARDAQIEKETGHISVRVDLGRPSGLTSFTSHMVLAKA